MSSSVEPTPLSPQIEQDARLELVHRLTTSQCLRSSNRLREFLLYITNCAVRNAPEEATEQEIGMHVFGRHAGYNSSEDSIVRTHARLLRQKLAEYFSTEGAEETLTMQIPKGHYLPVFESKSVHIDSAGIPTSVISEPLPSSALLPTSSDPAEPRRPKRHLALRWWLGFAAALLLSVPGLWMWSHEKTRFSLVDHFWKPFMSDNSSLVIYSNALFMGDARNGLRYATAQDVSTGSSGGDLLDDYTGVGELSGVYELTRLFDSQHSSFTLKRSRLVTWDEAKQRNLIFIGSVAENTALRDLALTNDFSITTGPGYSGVLNQRPKAGEQTLYSEPLYSLTKDYAILAYLPGQQSGRHMLVFSGLTTMGTRAAIDLACNRDAFEQLLRQAAAPNGTVRPFEAVIETAVRGGVPLQTQLVALHTH
jgi:hypothetical protein